MANNPPRVIQIPDNYFNMSKKEKQEWARSFLTNLVRPELSMNAEDKNDDAEDKNDDEIA